MNTVGPRSNQKAALRLLLILLLSASTVPSLRAQSDTDFDEYKVRISGFWFYSNPSGTIEDATTGDIINLHKDIGFNSYSTFSGTWTGSSHVRTTSTRWERPSIKHDRQCYRERLFFRARRSMLAS